MCRRPEGPHLLADMRWLPPPILTERSLWQHDVRRLVGGYRVCVPQLEPRERVWIGDFVPESTVTIDPEGSVSETDEANNVIELGPMGDPGVACL
jgi:hypothetical protein